MNQNNGVPGRRANPGSRPSHRSGDDRFIAAANRAARRAQQDTDNGPLPHAPRRRRNTPVDFASVYNLPPEPREPLEQWEKDDELAGRTDYDYDAASLRKAPPEDDPFDDDLPDDGMSDSPEAEPPRPGRAGAIDDSFLDEPDDFPSLSRKKDGDDPFDDWSDSPGRTHAPVRSRSGSGARRVPPSETRGEPARRSSLRDVRKAAAKRASRFSRKTKVIITVILLFIAANIIWISVWLFNNYTIIGGSLYGLDTAELDLSGQGITAVSGITRLHDLRYLNISGNQISIRQYNRLVKKLPGCEIIWDVPVGSVSVGNTVSDADLSSADGLKISDLSKALPYLPELRRLDVSGCGLDDEDLYELERSRGGLDLVWDVDILGRRISTDTDVVSIENASAQELEEAAGKIKYFDKLKYFDLSRSGMSEDEMFDFAVNHPEAMAAWETQIFGQTVYTNVLELRLEATADNPITDISCLRSFYKLQLLSINKGELKDLSPLKSLPALRILSLTRCKITDITDIGSLTGLVYLELNNNKITDISPLSALSELEELHLNSNGIKSIAPLSGLQKLKVLNVQKNNITSLKGFGDVPSLEIMSLQYNHLAEPADVADIYAVTSLRELDLSYNDLKKSRREIIIADLQRANPECNLYIWVRRQDD